MSAFRSQTTLTNHNPNKSIEVNPPPDDGITSLKFNPKVNFLIATSWDNKVRCWDIQTNGTTIPKAEMLTTQPALCSAWKDDGLSVFTAGCDKQARLWPLVMGQNYQVVAAHDAPIRQIDWISEINMLVTSSWDKTLKYWDLRSPNPTFTQQLPDKAFAMNVRYPLMVVGTSDRNIIVYDLNSPQKEFKRLVSPLKYQTRCLTTFPDKQGYLVGSIEGRVAVHHIDDSLTSKNFTFKCHRDGNEIFSVNSIDFHPVHGTFATAGSDGAFNFWDKDSKQRLKSMQRCPQPISCASFNHDGTIYAYASSYDWSKGAEHHNPSTAKNYIFLHATQDAEVKSKPKAQGAGTRR